MTLRELFQGLSVVVPEAASALQVHGICHDSREVEAGDLYVAIPGERFDGRDFAAAAAERGAVAVLGQAAAPEALACPWFSVADPRALLGPLAARIYENPHEELITVGVTGTNGKTSVVRLVSAMLDAAGRPCGHLGTLGYRFGEVEYAAGLKRTTPEAPDFFHILRQMITAGARAAAMEVSSHGLELGRTTAARFDVAAWTNLTHDHLDFHGNMENYYRAKRKLFDQLKDGGRSVVPGDGLWGHRLSDELPGALKWGESGENDIRPRDLQLDAQGIRGEVTTPRGDLRIDSPLLGRYNLHNLLTAIAVGEALELPPEALREAIAQVHPLPGRLEPVDAGQPFPALIDYAHTPDALRAALDALPEIGTPHIAAVFGCGGERDQAKRPLMGRIAAERAAFPVLTSDNPRGEDPEAILDQVEEGLRSVGHRDYRRFVDRREAIRAAVHEACEAAARGDAGWGVLVAGKGHEEVQILGDRSVPFSDREELFAALAEHGYGKKEEDGSW